MSFWDFLKSLPAAILFLLVLSVPIAVLAGAGVVYWAISHGQQVEFGDYGLPKRISRPEAAHVRNCRELKEGFEASQKSLADQIRTNSDRIAALELSVQNTMREYSAALRYDTENKLREFMDQATAPPLRMQIERLRGDQAYILKLEADLRAKKDTEYKNFVTMCWAALRAEAQ